LPRDAQWPQFNTRYRRVTRPHDGSDCSFASALTIRAWGRKNRADARPHGVAFTMDQYADAWPEEIAGSGGKVAEFLFAASGSKTVATDS
jgi:hypothetical protein